MIDLYRYIMENARTTSSNSERLKELEAWLKGKNYPNYIKTLNKMLEDPKAKALLVDGFGGDLGETKFTYSVQYINPMRLMPTQNEIDISKSLKHGLTKAQNIDNCFKETVIINNMPLVTFRGTYIIDGHHRWMEAACINPNCKMLCFDYDADISPIQMLKAVQGSIAAAIADNKSDEEKIPSSKTDDQNVYDDEWTESKTRKYVEETMSKSVRTALIDNVEMIEDESDAVDYIVDNIIEVKSNNHPISNAPSRGEMPQTDKGAKDKKSSMPNEKGSALNRMKNGKFSKATL